MPKLLWKPGTLLAPVPPALVSCGTLEMPNVLTIAWTGIVNSDPAMTYVSLRPERYSHGLISENGEFVVNLTTAALVRATDFCGVRSGRDLDKFATCGLTPEKSGKVSAPSIAECPLSLECVVRQVLPLGSHDMFLAEIVAVGVDPALVDRAGKLHLGAAGLAAYAHGEYFELGKPLGTFGFSVRKKPAGGRRGPGKKSASHRAPRGKNA